MGKIVKIAHTTDRAIAEMQLDRLHEFARERLLSLEETKQVEILTKILYNAREKNQEPDTQEAEVKKLTDAELVKIAETSTPTEEALVLTLENKDE